MSAEDEVAETIASDFPDRPSAESIREDFRPEEILELFCNQNGIDIRQELETESEQEALKGRTAGNYGDFYVNTHFSHFDDEGVHFNSIPLSFEYKEHAEEQIDKLLDQKLLGIYLADVEGLISLKDQGRTTLHSAACIIGYGSPSFKPSNQEEGNGCSEHYFRQLEEAFDENSISVSIILNGSSENEGYTTAGITHYITRTADSMLHGDYKDIDWMNPGDDL